MSTNLELVHSDPDMEEVVGGHDYPGHPDYNKSVDALLAQTPSLTITPETTPRSEQPRGEEVELASTEDEIGTEGQEAVASLSKDPAVNQLLQEYPAHNAANPPKFNTPTDAATGEPIGHNFSMGSKGEVSHGEVMSAAQKVIEQGGDGGQPSAS